MKHIKLLGIVLSTLTAISVFALSTDSQKPMNISSDSFNGNYTTGNGTYVGHVISNQGTRHLTANKLTVKRDSAGQITAIHAYGDAQKLAYMRTTPGLGEKAVQGHAEEIIYQPKKHLVTFLKHAKITQGGRLYEGQKATYNTFTQVMRSPHSGNGRTLMIIPPQDTTKGAKSA